MISDIVISDIVISVVRKFEIILTKQVNYIIKKTCVNNTIRYRITITKTIDTINRLIWVDNEKAVYN